MSLCHSSGPHSEPAASRGNRTENNLRVVDHHKEDRGYAWLVSINFESKHVESAEHDYGKATMVGFAFYL